MADAKEKLRCDVETVQAFARDNMHDMTCADYVAMKQVCAALSDVLNAPSTPPADAALADDALCESLIEASDMRWNGDVYIGDGADLMNLVRAALRARAVPDEPPEWPEYREHGMGCGIEDRGITDRYEACRYGFEEAVERCVEAFDNWLAASKAG